MQSLKDTYKTTGQLHHGYLLPGEKDHIRKNLENFFEKSLNVSTRANPDYIVRDAATFTVDDARDIGAIHVDKPLGNIRLFVLSFSFITAEAQNALLKMLEEPHAGTHFFIIVPTAEILLPTVLSRLFILRNQSGSILIDPTLLSVGHKFLSASPKKRLEIAKSLVDQKEEAIALLQSLTHVLRAKTEPKNMTRDQIQKIKMLISSSQFLYERGSSVKMVLEHIALMF